MHVGFIFLAVIVGSILFHIFTPWYWTDIASNWGAMDDTITLSFWIGGGVFIAVCLFMIYCVFKFSYKEGRQVEYKPEEGDIYFFTGEIPHGVTKNMSDEDRISIAFNFNFEDIFEGLQNDEDSNIKSKRM